MAAPFFGRRRGGGQRRESAGRGPLALPRGPAVVGAGGLWEWNTFPELVKLATAAAKALPFAKALIQEGRLRFIQVPIALPQSFLILGRGQARRPTHLFCV